MGTRGCERQVVKTWVRDCSLLGDDYVSAPFMCLGFSVPLITHEVYMWDIPWGGKGVLNTRTTLISLNGDIDLSSMKLQIEC